MTSPVGDALLNDGAPLSPRGGRVWSRRGVLASTLALGACGQKAQSAPPGVASWPLKAVARFPVGTCVQAAQLDDPAFASLVAAEVSQLTPEWELKMEYVLQPDGGYRFDAPDRIATFAADHGMRVFGHTLVWYAQRPAFFERLAGDAAAFRNAFSAYVTAVVGRYKGRIVGWDVVNEQVGDDGSGWRTSLWSQALGPLDHMRIAYDLAHAADPAAALFLNDYNLESDPAKRADFLRLAEALLKAGAPLHGLGSQTHVAADLAPGAVAAAIRDLAGLGLKVRISEMDVSLARARGLVNTRADLERRQAALYAEAAEAFAALPPAQRFDFTFWGLEDSQSWLKREDEADAPLLFDDSGRPKPAVAAWEAALRR
ncbi:MAG TPA: endo-1,4-beta-xylanase [Caulobacteraceae bacterium]|nr:endo-1,4-beta-xylanase [Caulobacteraceae bacterium]